MHLRWLVRALYNQLGEVGQVSAPAVEGQMLKLAEGILLIAERLVTCILQSTGALEDTHDGF